MKKYYYSALVALTIWLGSVSTDTWAGRAGRAGRRAAEMCKSEACDGGDLGSGPLVPWYIGIPLLIAILWFFGKFEQRGNKD